jgi:hypothetical protein
MKLFYCKVGPRWGRFDLFVHADTPSEAGKLWAQHYASDDDWRPKKVQVYDLSQLAICASVMDWDKIPRTIVGAP